jgi:hypothetical protein
VAIVAPRVLHGRTAAAGGDVRQAFAVESGDDTARFEADATLRAARDACLANMSRGLIGARRVLGCVVPRSAFTGSNTPPPKVCYIPFVERGEYDARGRGNASEERADRV